MKIVNHKILTFAVLALMFSVVVSGGCGGGGGGHYSGDFGNSGGSGQEVTPESVSQDVPPAPEPEPVSEDQYGNENADSDDDYGVGNNDENVTFTDLSMLNNVDWNIESIRILDSQGYDMPVYQNTFKLGGSQNITINNLGLSITDGLMLWTHGTDSNVVAVEDLTIDFRALSSSTGSVNFNTQAAPILRIAQNFTEINSNANSSTKDYQANIRVTQNGQSVLIGIETLRIAKKFPTYVIIENQFVINSVRYTSYLTLRASKSNLFTSINNTTWQVNSIRVAGVIKDSNGNLVNDNPTYYPIGNSVIGNITLLTSIDNNGRVLNVMNENGQTITTPLTTTFSDNRRSASNLVAPILRPASGFQYKGNQNGYEVFDSTLQTVNEANGRYPNTEILYISNSYILLNNSFYLQDNFYWATLVLEPYKPERLFKMLNNTSWKIQDIYIMCKTNNSVEENFDYTNSNNYNYNIDKLTLHINGEQLVWSDGNGTLHNNGNDPLTLTFTGVYGRTFKAPILRASSGFKYTKNEDNSSLYEASFGNLGTETLHVEPNNPSSYIRIVNDFPVSYDYTVGNEVRTASYDYQVILDLDPYGAN